MKKNLIFFLLAVSVSGFGQQESGYLRLGSQMSWGLDADGYRPGVGLQAVVSAEDSYAENRTFIMEGGYSLQRWAAEKSTAFDRGMFVSHGLKFGAGFMFGKSAGTQAGFLVFANAHLASEIWCKIEDEREFLPDKLVRGFDQNDTEVGLSARLAHNMGKWRISGGADVAVSKQWPTTVWIGIGRRISRN